MLPAKSFDQSKRKGKICAEFSWKSFLRYTVAGFLSGCILLAVITTIWLTSNWSTTTVTTTTSTTSTSTTSTTTTATTSTTTTTTTTYLCSGVVAVPRPPGGWNGASVVYTFDGHTNDYYGQYNATSVGGPPQYTSTGYNGRGAAIRIDSNQGQHLTIENHMDFYKTNLTIEAWVYPLQVNLSVDAIVYAQTNSSVLGQYMWMMLRFGHIYGAFFGSDTAGRTQFQANQWQHMAFTYDYVNSTQTVYLDGVIDAVNYNASPCLVTAGIQTIGAVSNPPQKFFNGYIDQLQILFNRSKSFYEILNDATLVAHYSMDCSDYPALDSGPNQIHGVAVDLTIDGGRVNQAYLFNLSTAYFQVTNLVLLGQSYRPYSFSMWLRPIGPMPSGGTILHVSSQNDGTGWCMPFLGLDSMGRIVANGWDGTIIQLVGPTLTVNEWVHVTLTYSQSRGMRLFVNSGLVGQSNPFVYAASALPLTITLGQSLNGNSCNRAGIFAGNYRGQIDEFFIYSREIDP